jgi:hypothetical protein
MIRIVIAVDVVPGHEVEWEEQCSPTATRCRTRSPAASSTLTRPMPALSLAMMNHSHIIAPMVRAGGWLRTDIFGQRLNSRQGVHKAALIANTHAGDRSSPSSKTRLIPRRGRYYRAKGAEGRDAITYEQRGLPAGGAACAAGARAMVNVRRELHHA